MHRLNSPLPRLLSVKETSKHLGISEEQCRRYIRREQLAVVRLGRRVLVHPEDLGHFIDSLRTKSSGTDIPHSTSDEKGSTR